jgi:hypothetical protein
MTRRAPARKRPRVVAVPRVEVVQPNKEARTSDSFTALLESVMQPILAVTYWFDPAPQPKPYPVTVRFSGCRVDVTGRMQAGDRFEQDETIEHVVPGSGPISLTARVRNINSGKWVVTAHMLGSARPTRGAREQENATPAADRLGPIVRLWHRWAPDASLAEQSITLRLK